MPCSKSNATAASPAATPNTDSCLVVNFKPAEESVKRSSEWPPTFSFPAFSSAGNAGCPPSTATAATDDTAARTVLTSPAAAIAFLEREGGVPSVSSDRISSTDDGDEDDDDDDDDDENDNGKRGQSIARRRKLCAEPSGTRVDGRCGCRRLLLVSTRRPLLPMREWSSDNW